VIWGGGCGPVETISGFTRPSDVVLGEQRDRLYVSDAGSGEVVLIDGANGQVATKIPVGVRPGKLALDEARGLLYVADQAEGVLSMIDLETLSVVRTTDVAAGPLLDMVVDGAGGRVYVLHLGPPPRRQVAVIDAQTGEVTASLAGDSDHPLSVINDLALDPQRGTLYLAGVRQMLAVDTASFALNAATPIDAVLYGNGMVVDQESGEIYLADNSSGELLVVGPQIGSR
jgi:YVTN family beta-propeller protein